MKLTPNSKPINFPKLFKRYSITLFVVFNAIFLIIAVLALQQVVSNSETTNSESASQQLFNIDTSVIKKIDGLYPSSEVISPPAIPSGRINPFAEK